MATGGSSNAAKLTMSEPRNARASAGNRQFERASQDGASVEDRLNNWEFLHWQPTALVGVSGKRVKRGNEEREKLKEWEGKDCPVCPEDSSPQAERKHRTPLTFPRTRMGQSTRHVAMENLRQHLTFSDAEELDRVSTDGERNNERYVQLPPKSSPATRGPTVVSSVRVAGRDNTVTRNLNHDEAQPDSNQIVGRLMQIRDYIKQASTMMDKLHASLDPGDMNRAGQLEQVILRLKEQEKKYLELLLELSVAREDNLFSGRHNGVGAMPNMHQETESETTELEEVQSDTTDGTVDDTRPRIEDHLGVHSDADHDDTFGSQPVTGAAALNPTPRPNDLDGNSDGEPQPSPGHTTDLVQRRHILETDLLKKSDELEALKEQYNLLRKVLVQKEELQALQHRQATLLSLQEAAGNSLSEIQSTRKTSSEVPDGATAVDASTSPDTPKQDDSDATSDVTGTEGTADNVDTDNVDTDNVDTDNVDTDNVDAAVAAIAADMGFTIESSGDVVPDDLRDLRHRLNYLKNLYDIKEQLSDGVNQVDSHEPKSVDELSALAQERHLLESKLQDLQQKKQHMDSLLSDLQSLRSQRQRAPSNNELEVGCTTSSQLQTSEVVAVGTVADRKSTEVQEVLDMLDTRNKMKKLHEVRERLDQLKDLAQYYQGGSEFVHGADGATYAKESVSCLSEYDKPENTSTQCACVSSEMGDRDGMNEFLKIYQQLAYGSLPVEDAPSAASTQPAGDANPVSRVQPQGSSTQPLGRSQPQGGAQMVGGTQKRKGNDEGSGTGTVESFVDRGESVDFAVWEDDPEVMAKVRRLQTAKEKLHRLQELVAMVQQSSCDVVQTLPSSIAGLVSEIVQDDPEVTQPVAVAIPQSRVMSGASGSGMSAAQVPQPAVVTGCPFGQREAFYEAKVKQQQRTLEELMDEKCKLLAIQNELQRLHETLPQAAAAVQRSSNDRSQQKDAAATGTSSAVKRQPQQQNDASEHRSNRMSSDNASSMVTSARGGPEPAQVTFQEPLETVVSNEELYDRMRQQRMLREELREKKRELEYMMSKDRPRKQYSRNQDTQSDNMSYSAKSDPFGASASVDVTMATWGGSTADNLESIEEDENVSGDGQECDDDNDDGYPSDGIMQVEEEEEANGESDDHATYTIEDEYASRRRQTSMPADNQHVSRRHRRNKVRSAPQSGREVQNDGDYSASCRRCWPSSQSPRFLNDTRGSSTRQPTTTRRRQHSKSLPRHPHHNEAADPATTRHMQQQLTSVRSDLNNVTQLLHILMRENPALATTARSEEVMAPPMVSGVPDMLSAPLAPVSGTTQVLRQQQQLIANLSHSFNELLTQQGELVQRFTQLERWLAAGAIGGQTRNGADFTFDPVWDNSSATSTLHGGTVPSGSPLGRGRQWAQPGCTPYDAVSPWSRPFDSQHHTMPGKPAALKSSMQQHRMAEPPHSCGASTKELPFPIVSGGSATWRSSVVTGTRSRCLQTSIDSRTPTTTELLASRDSIEVIKSSPTLGSDKHRKFPDRSEPSIKFCEVPMAGGTAADSDGESDVESICIETIQAADTKEEIPRLDLGEISSQPHRSRTMPQTGSSQVGGSGFTGEAVVGHQFTSARRAGAAAKLASQLGKSQPRCNGHEQQSGKSREGSQSAGTALRRGRYFPGLSSGISGTAFFDVTSNSSRRSSVQSSMAGDTDQVEASLRRVRASNNPALNSDMESDAPPSEFSLFEALRETIYSEVATLISQNENRPHFLIELFRELQLLTSDYLRQRALYAVQDLVTQYLAEGHKDGPEEKKVCEMRKMEMPWSAQPPRRNLSEMTPSDSIATSDDEEVKAHVYAQHAQSIVSREQKAQQLAAATSTDGWRLSTNSCRFDYLENVEITSSQSTPSTASSHIESPFARESLGDTVIHMDKMSEPSSFDTAAYIEHETLQAMREHECKLLEGESRTNESSRMTKSQLTDTSGMASLCQNDDDRSDVGSSSAQDQGSEGSTSDVTYPRIDTQQLDGEIKTIMLGVLPVLQEHMDDVCSQQLLEYVRQLVLSLTKPKGDNFEFLQFFNNQLNTILSDSLAKFDGRKMRDCGEDLLGELSEILFNELAFFRLMEDLNSTKCKVKATLQQWCHQESQTSSDAGATAGEKQRVNDDMLSNASSSSSSESADDWQSEESERSGVEKGSKEMKRGKEVTGNDNEEEDLGKARDDAFAAVVDIDEREDEEKETDTLQMSSVNFQLVPSELKPYTRIGSDEDDEGDDDEVASADDPSETAVSRDAEKDRINDSDDDTDTLSRVSGNTNHSCSDGGSAKKKVEEGEQEWEDVGEEDEHCDTHNGVATPLEDTAEENNCGNVESIELATADGPVDDKLSPEGAVIPSQKTINTPVNNDSNAALAECKTTAEESDTVTPDGASGSATDLPDDKQVDGKLENGNLEGEKVTIDDLPPKLQLVVKDAGSSVSPDIPLDTEAIVDMITPASGELAGNSDAIKEPASVPPNGTVKLNGTG